MIGADVGEEHLRFLGRGIMGGHPAVVLADQDLDVGGRAVVALRAGPEIGRAGTVQALLAALGEGVARRGPQRVPVQRDFRPQGGRKGRLGRRRGGSRAAALKKKWPDALKLQRIRPVR